MDHTLTSGLAVSPELPGRPDQSSSCPVPSLRAGATTLAVLPCCRGATSRTLMPELYDNLPEVPLPLELVALCMLRVLSRKGHEGKLDSTSEPPPRLPKTSWY